MIFKMSDNERNDNPPYEPEKGLVDGDREQDGNIDLEDTITALLASALLSTEPDNLNDLDDIAGEYSSLNNTIDELNRYFDRWEERHDQLRVQIQEALRENQEEEEEEQILEGKEEKQTSQDEIVSSENERRVSQKCETVDHKTEEDENQSVVDTESKKS